MIRFIISALFLVLFLILSMPVAGIEWLIGRKHPDVADRQSLAVVSWGFRVVRRISGVQPQVRGLENIPTDTAVLYVGNHQSFFDIILTCPLMTRPTGYVAKISMAHVPLLSVWMRRIHCLFLDRGDLRQGMQVIKDAAALASSGTSVFIFPEGTRNKVPDTLLPFHEGSFKIAQRAEVPIIPVTIVGTAAVFGDDLPRIHKRPVTIEFGTPIYPASLTRDEQRHIGETVREIIQETYNRVCVHSA